MSGKCEETCLVFDVDDTSGRRADPLRRYETLHASFLCCFNPRYLLVQVFPGDARNENVNSSQMVDQGFQRTCQVIADNTYASFAELSVGRAVDGGLACEGCHSL